MRSCEAVGGTAFVAESGLLPFEKHSLPSVPEGPGIYLFLDDGNRILFIGHAGGGPGLAGEIESRFNSGLWPEVSRFKWAATRDLGIPQRLAANLVREFDPPFNRPALDRIAS